MLKLAACGLIAALALPAAAEAQGYGRYGQGDRYARDYSYGYGGYRYEESISETEHQAYVRQGWWADGYSYPPAGSGYGHGGYGYSYPPTGAGYGGYGYSHGYGYGHARYGQGWRHYGRRWPGHYGQGYGSGYRDEYGYNDDRPRSRLGRGDGYYGRPDCDCADVYLRDD